MSTIFKKGLVSQVAETTGQTKAVTNAVIDATLEAIIDNLKKGNEVRISGYFSFLIKAMAERKGIIPLTRQPYTKPAGNVTKVLVGKKLRNCCKQ